MTKRERLRLMGKVVTASAVMWVTKDGRTRKWLRHELRNRTIVGWVVGFRTLQSGATDGGGYDEMPYFVAKEWHNVVMIAEWPTMKPSPVPLDAFVEGGTPSMPGWDKVARSRWSEAVKQDWPRDERGRFVSM